MSVNHNQSTSGIEFCTTFPGSEYRFYRKKKRRRRFPWSNVIMGIIALITGGIGYLTYQETVLKWYTDEYNRLSKEFYGMGLAIMEDDFSFVKDCIWHIHYRSQDRNAETMLLPIKVFNNNLYDANNVKINISSPNPIIRIRDFTGNPVFKHLNIERSENERYQYEISYPELSAGFIRKFSLFLEVPENSDNFMIGISVTCEGRMVNDGYSFFVKNEKNKELEEIQQEIESLLLSRDFNDVLKDHRYLIIYEGKVWDNHLSFYRADKVKNKVNWFSPNYMIDVLYEE